MKIAILWRNYGPYHYTRLEAAKNIGQVKGWTIIGVEVGDHSKIYTWQSLRKNFPDFTTLFPGQVDADIANLKFAWKFWNWLKVAKIDVIFCPSFWPAYALLSILLARLQGVQVVLMTDSNLETSQKSIFHFVIKKIICQNFSASFVAGVKSKKYVQSLGLPNGKIFTGYDIVDNDYFSSKSNMLRKNSEQQQRILNLNFKYILSLGRFVEKKNLFFVLNVYALSVRNKWVDGHRLLFVGNGLLKEALMTHAKGLGLKVTERCNQNVASDHGLVEFRDFVQLDTVPAYYAFASAFILASTVEEWGLVVNEAMASECLVLGSSVLGCAPDLLFHKKTGLIFNPIDEYEAAECMRIACCPNELNKILIKNARCRISYWGIEHFKEGFEKSVKTTASNRSEIL